MEGNRCGGSLGKGVEAVVEGDRKEYRRGDCGEGSNDSTDLQEIPPKVERHYQGGDAEDEKDIFWDSRGGGVGG